MEFKSHQSDGQNCAPETCGGTSYDPCFGALMAQPGPLGVLADKIASINMDNGWFEKDRPFEADIALLHSEVSEALEAYRDGYAPSGRYYDQNGLYSMVPIDPPTGKPNKPLGVPSELADVLVRVLDTCFRYGIDIDSVLEEKIKYNATRGHRHGGKVI